MIAEKEDVNIRWGVLDKSIQQLEGWEWTKQDVVEIDAPIERRDVKKLFEKLSKKVNPYLHYDCFKAIKNGGSIVKIAHLPVYIPPTPKVKSEYINGHIESIANQKWFRPLPSILASTQTKNPSPEEWTKAIEELNVAYAKIQLSKSKEELAAMQHWHNLIAREWNRVRNGCWVLINGEPTYICGSYYFFLTYWGNKEGKHNAYIEADLHEFLHWEAVLKSKGIKGKIQYCRRQDGKSTRMFCVEFWVALVTQRTCVVQGKDEQDIKINFAEHYTPKMKHLPFIFKPHAEKELKIAAGYKKSDQTTGKFDDTMKINILEIKFQDGIGYNGGKIIGFKPGAKRVDGHTPLMAARDEFGKTELVDIVVAFNTLAPAVSKVFMTTTVESIKDTILPQCRQLTDGSDYVLTESRIRTDYDCKEFAISNTLVDWCYSDTHTPFLDYIKRDKKFADVFLDLQGNFTITGMVQYIKPAWYCFIDRADGVVFVDDYGRSLSVEAYRHLKRQRDRIREAAEISGKMSEYYAYIRKYPFTIEEALSEDNTDVLFDLQAVAKQERLISEAKQVGKSYIEVPEKEYYMAELEGDTSAEAMKKAEIISQMEGVVKLNLYKPYSLKWKNNEEFTEVIAVPDKNGVHWIAEMPQMPNNVIRVVENGQVFFKPLNQEQTGGMDSVDVSTDDMTGKTKPSDFCLVVMNNSRFAGITRNRPIYRLKYRPRDPKEAYKEALKALWFYGCSAGLEDTKNLVRTFFDENNCILFFALSVMIDTTAALTKKQVYIRGNTMTDKDKEQHFLNETHWSKYYMSRITDEVGLREYKKVNYKNLTRCDWIAAKFQATATSTMKSKRSHAQGNNSDRTAYRYAIGKSFLSRT